MKTVQYFSKEYLEMCKSMSPDNIIKFIDDFRKTYGNPEIKKEINLKSDNSTNISELK